MSNKNVNLCRHTLEVIPLSMNKYEKPYLSWIYYNEKEGVMQPAHKIEEKIDQRLQNQPLLGGNLLYITQMNNSLMIQMTRPPFYI